jgi:hypothetical protein
MANLVPLDTLVSASACFDCLSPSEKLAAQVYFLALALNGTGGLDLTDVNTLRETLACYCVSDSRFQSFLVDIYQQAAIDSGAIAEAPTVSDLRASITSLLSLSKSELNKAIAVIIGNLLATVVT